MENFTATAPAATTFTVVELDRGTSTVMTLEGVRQFALSHLHTLYAGNRTMTRRVPELVEEKIQQAWDGERTIIAGGMRYGQGFQISANTAGW